MGAEFEENRMGCGFLDNILVVLEVVCMAVGWWVDTVVECKDAELFDKIVELVLGVESALDVGLVAGRKDLGFQDNNWPG